MIQFTIYKVHLTWPKLTQAIINRNKVIGGDNPAGLNLRIYGFRDPTLGLRPRRRAVGASSLLGGRRSEHVQVHERELRLSDTRVETQVQVPAWSQHTLERDKGVEWGKWSFLYTTTLDTTLSVAETHVIVTTVQCLRLSSRSSGLCSPPGWSILADCKCYRTTFCPCPCGRSGLPLRHLPSLLLDDLLHLRHLLLHLLHLLGVFFCWRPNKWRPNKWRPNKSA